MFDPTAVVLADRATRRHVLSARPAAPAGRPPRHRGDAVRRHTVAALRRLADHLEPRCVAGSAPAR
jgi:hypothetical protein